jgi:hypothetical protein
MHGNVIAPPGIGTLTNARSTFGTPANWALLWIVVAADILLTLTLIRTGWPLVVFEYVLLAVIMAAVIRLAVIVSDPRQPRRPGPGPNGNGDRWGGNPPWPPASYILLMLAASTIGIILTYTWLYSHFGLLGWRQGMLISIGTVSTVNGPPSGSSAFNWIGASQELIDLVFFSVVVTIALGRIR